MSDVYLGPGWWLASDGKWYDPDSHPDVSYREAFASERAAAVDEGVASFLTAPTVECLVLPTVEVSHTIDAVPSIDTVPSIDAVPSIEAEGLPEVAGDLLDLRDSAVEVEVQEPAVLQGRTKLEIRPKHAPESSGPVVNLNAPVPTAALVHLPAEREVRASVDGVDLIFLTLLLVGGLMIVGGTFLEWTVGADGQIGWDRPDGILTVGAGVAASTAVGPLYTGWRSLVRPAVVIAGVVTLMVVGVVIVATLTEAERSGLSLGVGIYVVLGGALAALTASAGLGPTKYR